MSSIHSCPKCEHGDNMDCASCKLAALSKKKADVEEDDDYSISERLTETKGDHSILFLFVAAVLIFGCVVLFAMLFKA